MGVAITFALDPDTQRVMFTMTEGDHEVCLSMTPADLHALAVQATEADRKVRQRAARYNLIIATPWISCLIREGEGATLCGREVGKTLLFGATDKFEPSDITCTACWANYNMQGVQVR